MFDTSPFRTHDDSGSPVPRGSQVQASMGERDVAGADEPLLSPVGLARLVPPSSARALDAGTKAGRGPVEGHEA